MKASGYERVADTGWRTALSAYGVLCENARAKEPLDPSAVTAFLDGSRALETAKNRVLDAYHAEGKSASADASVRAVRETCALAEVVIHRGRRLIGGTATPAFFDDEDAQATRDAARARFVETNASLAERTMELHEVEQHVMRVLNGR